MQVLNDFPQRIEKKDHVWIPMRDGCRLSGRIWLPDQAEQFPVPAILEYIPYRKNDGTALRDSLIHPYFAGHGYASVRVDLRGSGDSEGILEDEYLKQELEDAIEVLEWICERRDVPLSQRWRDLPGHGEDALHFRSLPAAKSAPPLYMPTELCPWRTRLLRGEVHDDNCWTFGGICGHAGLFGDRHGVLEAGRMWMDALRGSANLGPVGAQTVQEALAKARWMHARGWLGGIRRCQRRWRQRVRMTWRRLTPKEPRSSRSARRSSQHAFRCKTMRRHAICRQKRPPVSHRPKP